MSNTETFLIKSKAPSTSYSKLRKSEKTKQKILDTALEFLWSKSFRELTVKGLTDEAEISRTCFYLYFEDLHNLMEELLSDLEGEISAAAMPWFTAKSDVTSKLCESLYGVLRACYHRGPIFRAIVEAAPMDERLEKCWNDFVKGFDDAVTTRITQDQMDGLASNFEPRPVAIALNRMDIGIVIHHFGSTPQSDIQSVYYSTARIWLNTIYGKDDPVII